MVNDLSREMGRNDILVKIVAEVFCQFVNSKSFLVLILKIQRKSVSIANTSKTTKAT